MLDPILTLLEDPVDPAVVFLGEQTPMPNASAGLVQPDDVVAIATEPEEPMGGTPIPDLIVPDEIAAQRSTAVASAKDLEQAAGTAALDVMEREASSSSVAAISVNESENLRA